MLGYHLKFVRQIANAPYPRRYRVRMSRHPGHSAQADIARALRAVEKTGESVAVEIAGCFARAV